MSQCISGGNKQCIVAVVMAVCRSVSIAGKMEMYQNEMILKILMEFDREWMWC